MEWVDTHAHLTDHRLAEQLEQVVERAALAGVKRILCVGTTRATSLEAVSIAERFDGVFAAAGIHPTYAHQEEEGDWQAIESLLDHPRVVAMGETGLDDYWKECPMETQLASIARHWDASHRTGLPLILHMRECTGTMLGMLREVHQSNGGPLKGVLHSFTESWEVAEEMLSLGLYISFAGMVTYKKSDALRAVAARIPLDRLLVETDSPYLAPEPFRSKGPNEPSRVLATAQCIAEVRGIPLADLASASSTNALRCFPKMRG
jgi:TatD DNase family protein